MTETGGDSAELRLKRLKFRSWHRGFKEADLVLGHFADRYLEALDADGLDAYERLLEEPDQDIFDWVVGRREPPPQHDTHVMARLRELRHLAGTLWKR
ncbi:MAG: succinate dehydrogenase assembly factor 2 [Alphaproteobacteria bacterium]